MGRITYLLIILVLIALSFTMFNLPNKTVAQPPFIPTQDPSGNNGAPPFGDTGGPPIGQPIETPVGAPTNTPTNTPEPTQTPIPTPSRGQNTVFTVRDDLERLANETLVGRPDGWIGANDIYDPSAAINTRLDLEILAGTLLGANTRPDGWFGAVSSSDYAIARDIRYDLELLADAVLTGGRPGGWAGGAPLMRCNRSTQAIVEFLELNGVFTLNADPAAQDYCQEATIQAAIFMEINILGNPQVANSLSVPGLAIAGENATVNSDFAAAFLDRFANQRVGVVPNGTSFEAVGRSPSDFSNMMLIKGQGFLVFVDHQFTSVTSNQFNNLPPVDEANISPNCEANWCRG